MQSSKFYGLPWIHKHNTLPKPIVSSRGGVTYGVAKEFTNILRPLVSHSLHHHIINTQHFVEHIKAFQLPQGKCISSYDVKALFTYVLLDLAISIVKNNYNKTHSYTTGPLCLFNALLHCWSFALKYCSKSTQALVQVWW